MTDMPFGFWPLNQGPATLGMGQFATGELPVKMLVYKGGVQGSQEIRSLSDHPYFRLSYPTVFPPDMVDRFAALKSPAAMLAFMDAHGPLGIGRPLVKLTAIGADRNARGTVQLPTDGLTGERVSDWESEIRVLNLVYKTVGSEDAGWEIAKRLADHTTSFFAQPTDGHGPSIIPLPRNLLGAIWVRVAQRVRHMQPASPSDTPPVGPGARFYRPTPAPVPVKATPAPRPVPPPPAPPPPAPPPPPPPPSKSKETEPADDPEPVAKKGKVKVNCARCHRKVKQVRKTRKYCSDICRALDAKDRRKRAFALKENGQTDAAIARETGIALSVLKTWFAPKKPQRK